NVRIKHPRTQLMRFLMVNPTLRLEHEIPDEVGQNKLEQGNHTLLYWLILVRYMANSSSNSSACARRHRSLPEFCLMCRMSPISCCVAPGCWRSVPTSSPEVIDQLSIKVFASRKYRFISLSNAGQGLRIAKVVRSRFRRSNFSPEWIKAEPLLSEIDLPTWVRSPIPIAMRTSIGLIFFCESLGSVRLTSALIARAFSTASAGSATSS